MAPVADGSLLVSIPSPDGSVLVLLDREGRPQPGWPIVVADSTTCSLLGVAPDGSARVVCDGTDLPTYDNDASDVRAFAFDAGGALMPGWPVTFRPGTTGRVVGDALVVLSEQVLTDVDAPDEPDRPIADVWLTSVAADGAITSGVRAQVVQGDCYVQWSVGPDGVAYGAAVPWIDSSVSCATASPVGASQIKALDMDGAVAGWPIMVVGTSSPAAFGPGGRIVITAGSPVEPVSRVLAFDPGRESAPESSGVLEVATMDTRGQGDVDCAAWPPAAPVVAADGTIFVVGITGPVVYALDPTLGIRDGWPLQLDAAIERPDPYLGFDGLSCASQAVPAAGPDGTLHLPLHTPDPSVGGSIVAIGSDGAVRPGWPVELRKPGAEFWAVVAGPNGTAYALAIEPEANGGSSATVLALAPDSTVTYATTIIEP